MVAAPLRAMMVVILIALPALISAGTPTFSQPLVVSDPVQCYDGGQKKLCGYVQNATCKCPGYPMAAGGTDGFYGLDANATQMMGLYKQLGNQGNELTFTSDGGRTWKLKKFVDWYAAFDWNLYPVTVGGKQARRNFGGISQGSFRSTDPSVGNYTDSSWTGKKSATFSFDSSGELQMSTTGAVTVGPLSQAVNKTTGPIFYGGPIRLGDGSLLGTIGVFWSADDPLSPTPDGPMHRMSIVAVHSTDDGFSWQYKGAVANASGAGGYPTSIFGPDENDIAVLGDGKTLICVIRMDGDAGCSTNSYRYFAAIYSHDQGASWSRAVPIPGAGCVRPKLLKLAGGPLILSGGRLCVEKTDDISIWVNDDGMAGAATGGPGKWTKHSVSYWHNAKWAGPTMGHSEENTSWSYLFDSQINNSNAFATLAYTSLIPAGERRACRYARMQLSNLYHVHAGDREFVLIYQKFFSPHYWPPWPQATFQMRVRV